MNRPANARKPKLLDQVRAAIRIRHYSIRTEEAYVRWIKRFVLFYGKRHPSQMREAEIKEFLTHLAVNNHVSASTQNQALSALLFLYREVLGQEIGWLDGIVQAKKPERRPVVLTKQEVEAVLNFLDGSRWFIAALLYGAGLRLLECLRLRVKDADFSRNQIVVRDGKGQKDRLTMFPSTVKAPLVEHLKHVKRLHARDLREGFGRVSLPYALERKDPHANQEWGWQYIFPARKRSIDPRSGKERRPHLHESVPQRAVKEAARQAGIAKLVSCHTLRHSFATHLLEDGYDIRTIQELPWTQGVRTTMIYTHVLNRGGQGVRSPLDGL